MKRVLIAAALLAAAAAAPAAAQTRGRPATTYQQTVERQLITLVEEWARAARAGDGRALERLHADDFSSTTADGQIKDKKEYVADYVNGARKLTDVTFGNFQARVHGNTAALLHSGTLRGTQGGRDLSGRYRWTRFFVRRGARWRCVASQATRLAIQ